MVTKITTVAQLKQAITGTYMTDAIIAIAFVVLIIIVANLISWQPGAHDSSPAKRKAWFWILGVASLFTSLGVDYFTWMKRIGKAQLLNQYIIHMIAASVVCAVLYGLVTFVICKLQKKDTKLASMF
jgi:hypothetical protein